MVYVEVKLGHLAILNCSAVVKVTVPNLSKDYFFQVRDDGAGKFNFLITVIVSLF